MANWRPMQARWPEPNGLKALGGNDWRVSGRKWSGLNSSASGPQIAGSRCSIGVSAVIEAPLGIRKPPSTVSSYG